MLLRIRGKKMTTEFNGLEFMSLDTRTFRPTFEGAQARRPETQGMTGSLIGRRTARRDRRANRAL
jgi:hypothetical protein